MSRTLRLNVLGRFELLGPDGKPIHLNSKKAQALLGYLAVERGRAQTRDQAATLLWGETGEERARHNLRQALSKIRTYCDSLVASRGESLEIDMSCCSVDVEEFDRLARSRDADELRRCLDIYRGDLMEGYLPREPAYVEWLLPARERLRGVACDVADRLVDALVTQDRIEDAMQALNGRLQMDPACEPAHAKLMKLLTRVGRRSDALRQYRVCVDALQRELGAEPSAETQTLYAKIHKSESDVDTEQVHKTAAPDAMSKDDRPTVAVLPFENLSGGEHDYFVDGMVEDLTTALSRFSSLLVIARGSSFSYRGREVSDQQIAQELGAQFLVRGSLQRADRRVRINVQLLDARAGLNVWGDRFDREVEDVFVVQDEITSILVSTLAGQVEAARLAQARRAPPERLQAYDMVLRGKDHHHRFTAEDCRKSIEMLEGAIERDPGFAVAHAWLACALGQAMVFELDEHATLLDRAQASAERGMDLDENEAECHRILAQTSLTRRNLKRSLWHQERALFLNPNDDRTVCAMGEILSFLGRHEEAEQWVRNSMRLNPYHPQRYWTHLARPLFHLGRFRETLDALERIGRLRKDDHTYRIAASARLGDARLLERNITELREALPDFDPVEYARALPYEHDDDRDAVLSAVKTAIP